jgi:hypothetical protein
LEVPANVEELVSGPTHVSSDAAQPVPAPPEVSDATRTNVKKLLTNVKRVRQALQLAVLVSPLVAILSLSLTKDAIKLCPEELLIVRVCCRLLW